MRSFLTHRWQLLLCLVLGALSVLAFAPFGYSYLLFLTLAALCWSWYDATPRQAFTRGFAFGLGTYLVGTSWVYNSLAVYGGMPLWMGGIAVLGFSSLVGVFVGFSGLALAFITSRKSLQRLALFAPSWVVFEWCKSWVLTGFPWLDIGYSQTDTLLFELAPVGGIYLISLAIALLASCLVVLFVQSQIALLKRAAVAVIALAVVLSLSLYSAQSPWGENSGEPLHIGVVQPNTPIERKWGPAYRNDVISGLVQRNTELLEKQSLDLIVWPETALPVLLSQTDAAFWSAVRPKNAALLTGLVERHIGEQDRVDDYNAAVLHCGGASSSEPQVYRKRHLVPFGEYLPLRFLFQWVIDYLQLPMSDFTSWQQVQTLECGNTLKLGLSICYEDAFSEEHRVHTRDATVLVNISEDAWFGDSFAPHQRLQMAQMRAKELALPLVRSANTGPSVLIDHRGKIITQTKQFVSATLSGDVQPRTGETWYRALGEWVIYLSLMLLIVPMLMKFIRSRRKA